MKNYFILLISFAVFFCLTYVKASVLELPLEQRISNAELIIEGKISNKKCMWNDSHTKIITIYTVETYKILKGSSSKSEISFIQEGGKMGDTICIVNPSAEINLNDYGLFFLKPDLNHKFNSNLNSYLLYSGIQGYVSYDNLNHIAYDLFNKYTNIENEIYQTIEQITNTKIDTKKEIINYDKPLSLDGIGKILAQPSITSISPTDCSAGTHSVLTINGKNFGTQVEYFANVQFTSAENGGTGFVYSTPPTYIIDWSDTQIHAYIPYNAGSGPIKVVNSAGLETSSTQSLNVKFCLTYGSGNWPGCLINQENGGYVFNLHTSMFGNTANYAFRRALQRWRYESGINLNVNDAPVEDGDNLIYFDKLAENVLGQTVVVAVEDCTKGTEEYYQVIYMGIAFNTDFKFNFDQISNKDFHFESIAFHELGHTLLLGHIVDAKSIMYYASLGYNLKLTQYEYDGVSYVKNRSLNKPCGETKIVLLKTGEYAINPPQPKADFYASADFGVAPFTIDFSDISLNSPNKWVWDFNNDGKVDDNLQNPVYTFTKSGRYNVSLAAYSNWGADTIVKEKYIYVYDKLVADAGQDQLICNANIPVMLGGDKAVIGGVPPFKYKWTDSHGEFSNEPNPTINVNSDNTLILAITDSLGNIASDTVTLTINPYQPKLEYSGNTTFCTGDSILLSVNSGTENTTYLWSDGKKTKTNKVKTSGNFYVDVSYADGCKKSSDSVRITTYENKKPIITAIGKTKFCEGDSVILKANTGLKSYLWSNGKVEDRISVKESGTYFVTATNQNDCISKSDVIKIEVNEIPGKPIITQLSGDTLVSSSDNYNQWFKDGNAIGGATKKKYKTEPLITADYTVQVEINDCKSEFSEIFTYASDIFEKGDESTLFEIIPNPAGDFITVTLKPSEGFEPSEGSEIQIYNTLGEKVMSVGIGRDLSTQINISDLPKGIYIVKVGTRTAKFVKI